MDNLSKNTKLAYLLKASTAYTSVTTGVDGQVLDMSGFNSVEFIFPINQCAVSGALTCSVMGSTASGGTYQALSGATVTSTTGVGDALLAIELDRPTFRYLRPRVASATSDVRHGGCIALVSNAKNVPVTHDSTSMQQTLVRVVNAAT